jgi:hypothetical protein
MTTTSVPCSYCRRPVTDETGYIYNDRLAIHEGRCQDSYQARQEKIKEIRSAVSAIIAETNGGDTVAIVEGLVQAIRTNHRTLQQAFIGVIKDALVEYGKAECGYDLRNEASVEWARKVSVIDENGFPRI